MKNSTGSCDTLALIFGVECGLCKFGEPIILNNFKWI